MGYRCRWIGARGKSAADIEGPLEVRRRGRSDAPVLDPGMYGVALAGAWYVTMGDGHGYMDYLDERQAEALSRSGETLFFHTDDGEMSSRLAGYAGGELSWALAYEPGQAQASSRGDVPEPALEALKRAGDGVYDGIADAALALTGFRHDRTLATDGAPAIDLLVSLRDEDVFPVKR